MSSIICFSSYILLQLVISACSQNVLFASSSVTPDTSIIFFRVNMRNIISDFPCYHSSFCRFFCNNIWKTVIHILRLFLKFGWQFFLLIQFCLAVINFWFLNAIRPKSRKPFISSGSQLHQIPSSAFSIFIFLGIT